MVPEQPKQPQPYEVQWANAARKQLRRIDRKDQPRILEATRALGANPRHEGVERKTGPWAAFHTVSVGIHYRVAFTIDDSTRVVVVAKVGRREGFYKALP